MNGDEFYETSYQEIMDEDGDWMDEKSDMEADPYFDKWVAKVQKLSLISITEDYR